MRPLHRLHRLGVTGRTKQLNRAELRLRFWCCPFRPFTFHSPFHSPFLNFLHFAAFSQPTPFQSWKNIENIPNDSRKKTHEAPSFRCDMCDGTVWHCVAELFGWLGLCGLCEVLGLAMLGCSTAPSGHLLATLQLALLGYLAATWAT